MGLDQYARYCPANLIGDKHIGFEEVVGDTGKEFFYWRKHPGLQGWMEKLYKTKGGTDEFNCVVVRLDEADLAALENDIKRNGLPQTSGSFFGAMRDTYDQDEEDLRFITQARDLIASGFAVFYTSWW